MNEDIEYILLDEAKISESVKRVAEQINSEFGSEPILAVVILKGSMFFASDLLRQLHMPVTVDFMKVSSYNLSTESSGSLSVALDVGFDLTGLNVLIIEDIVDTGNTLSRVKMMLAGRGAKCVKICTLLDKPERRETEIEADYVGAVIPNEFVVGYGLDYAEEYRALPYVGILKKSVYSK